MACGLGGREPGGPDSTNARSATLSSMTTIVLCIDGSEGAARAARAGVSVLRPADTVLVVTVVEGTDPTLAYDGTGHAGPTMTDTQFDAFRQEELQNAQVIVDETIKQLGLEKSGAC